MSKTAGELFGAVVNALASDSSVSQSRMFGSPGLKIGGKVFAMLVKDKLVVKLPREQVEELVESAAGEYFDPGHGKLMKEWVALKPTSEEEWLRLAKEAEGFVRSQKR